MFGTWCIPNSALPPDVILEVGPQPCCTRYAAHGSLLAIHSGYLRAALRTVIQTNATATSGSLRRISLQHPHMTANDGSAASTNGTSTATTTILFLHNVTAEQFTPLLTYMYTGYLDLTMDNIFGVLLATHLLHMPRALELCRTFLASSSSTVTSAGGLGQTPGGVPLMEGSLYGLKTTAAIVGPALSDGPKLVRPIASKALATVGLNFISPPTASQINLLPSASFRSLGPALISPVNHMEELPQEVNDHSIDCRDSPSQSPISVTEYEDYNTTPQTAQPHSMDNNDSMDSITVDVRSDEYENEPATSNVLARNEQQGRGEVTTRGREISSNRTRKNATVPPVQTSTLKRNKSTEVATDGGRGGNSVIVDIASCDGPVRFRRVLNVMYGCNKNNRSPNSGTPDDIGISDGVGEDKRIALHHRSMRYASSFHQQMARNISDTGKLTEESSSSSSYGSLHSHAVQHHHKHHEQPPVPQIQQHEHEVQKDENSQTKMTTYSMEEPLPSGASSSCFTCVYCKHSFKSHYCYQKHAKRHLIPLRLDHGSNGTLITNATCEKAKNDTVSTMYPKKLVDGRRRSQTMCSNGSSSSVAFKREVKPLDMNVQYYPCKTCGSKFPSYYFVHKHRKLCHAEEDDDAAGNGNTLNRAAEQNVARAGDDAVEVQLDSRKDRDRTQEQCDQAI